MDGDAGRARRRRNPPDLDGPRRDSEGIRSRAPPGRVAPGADPGDRLGRGGEAVRPGRRAGGGGSRGAGGVDLPLSGLLAPRGAGVPQTAWIPGAAMRTARPLVFAVGAAVLTPAWFIGGRLAAVRCTRLDKPGTQ